MYDYLKLKESTTLYIPIARKTTPIHTAIVIPAAIGLNIHLKPTKRTLNPVIILIAELLAPENPSIIRKIAMMVAQKPIKNGNIEVVKPGWVKKINPIKRSIEPSKITMDKPANILETKK